MAYMDYTITLTVGNGWNEVTRHINFWQCNECRALVPFTDGDKQAHTNWHDRNVTPLLGFPPPRPGGHD